jgi:hypothetical protein
MSEVTSGVEQYTLRDAPTASDAPPEGPVQPGASGSLIVTPVRAISPVFVTVTFQYAVLPEGITALETQGPLPPGPQSEAESDPHTCLMIPSDAAGMVTVEGGEVTGGPEGGVPVAVAVLTMEPAPRSAWVVR